MYVMKTKVKFAATACVEFGAVMLLAQLANTLLYRGMRWLLESIAPTSIGAANALSVISYFFTVHLFPYFLIFFFLRAKVGEHYMGDVPKPYWIKSGLIYMLPGEIVRGLICLLPSRFFAGRMLARGFYNVYYATYRIWSRRYDLVFTEPIPQDYLAILGLYFVYIIPGILILMAIYRHYWKKADKEHQQWLETRMTQSEY